MSCFYQLEGKSMWHFLVRPLYVANYVVTYIYKNKKLTRDESENASRAKKGLPWLYSGP